MKRIAMLCLLVAGAFPLRAQDMWKYFAPEDFAKRRAAVMDSIGDGVAIFLGAELPEAFVKFRQDNNFYYLSGVETPDAVLILDGRSRVTLLLVPDYTPGDIKREARIEPGPESAASYRVDRVLPRRELTATFDSLMSDGRTVYLYQGPEEIAFGSDTT